MRLIATVFLLLVTACSVQDEVSATSTTASPATTGTTTPASASPTTSGSSGATVTPATTTTTLPPMQGLAYEEVAQLSFPVQMTALPGADISYVVTKEGLVLAFEGTSVSEDPVLDISDRVRNEGERGLLAIAQHPDDPTRLFAHYSAGDGDTVVSEFTLTSESQADADSERVLFRHDQPAANHNGGMILFGPDGRLYLGLGDGGGANDQFGNGQDQGTLLAGLVAMNVDGEPEPTLFDYGLRNPWRFWLDQGLLYVADVGQNEYEEVSVTGLAPGINFGWSVTEGLHCFNPSSDCDTTGITLPVIEVAHGDAGTCSITGGIVYRGVDIPEIDGHYFYSDYCGGYLRSFRYDRGEAVDITDWTDQVGVPGGVVGFGVDGRGEMYVTTTDHLLRVVAVRG